MSNFNVNILHTAEVICQKRWMPNFEKFVVALENEVSRLGASAAQIENGDIQIAERERGDRDWTNVSAARLHDLRNTISIYQALLRTLNKAET